MKKKQLLLSIFMICFTIFSGMLVGCGNPDPMIVYINNEEEFINYYNDNFPSKQLIFENWMGKQYANVISYELTSNITITTPLKNKVTKFYDSRINNEDYTEEEARGYVGSSRTYVIDGKGYTVSGLNFTGYMAGFLGSNYGSVTIKNITFDNMTINSFGYTGGILGKVEGTIELDNVHIKNSTITNSEDQATGGFIGLSSMAKGHIKNCSIENTTLSSSLSTDVGGFVGKIASVDDKHIIVSDSSSLNNTITGNLNVSGVIGQFYQEYENEENRVIEFKNLINSSGVHALNRRAGGIMGFLSYWDNNNYKFTNCKNESNTDATKLIKSEGNSAGGIIGSTDWNGSAFRIPTGSQLSFSQCSNNMIIQGNDYVGGISGFIDDKLWALNYNTCENKEYGDINGSSQVGGIVGSIDGTILGGSQFTFTNCVNQAFVTGSSEYIGGICGFNNNLNPLFDTCSTTPTNNGFITGKKYVGGISGAYGTFTNCTNSMDIKHNGSLQTTWEYVGGISGFGKNSTFTNCSNSGDIIDHSNVTGVNAKYIGGITGYTNQLMLTNCTNSGDITGSDCVGGLVGKSDATWLISPKNTLVNCSNSGNIYAIGQSTTTLENYTNDDIDDVKGKIGLMVGALYSGTLIFDFTDSTVSGDIYVIGDSDYIGAWCGILQEGDEETLASATSSVTLTYKIYVNTNTSETFKTHFKYGENVFEELVPGFNHPTSVENFTYTPAE